MCRLSVPETKYKTKNKEILAHNSNNSCVQSPEFLYSGRKSWTLDSGRWTLKMLDAKLWTPGIGCWILDVKTLRFTVNSYQANVLFLFNHLKISKTRGFQRFSDDMKSELQLEMN